MKIHKLQDKYIYLVVVKGNVHLQWKNGVVDNIWKRKTYEKNRNTINDL